MTILHTFLSMLVPLTIVHVIGVMKNNKLMKRIAITGYCVYGFFGVLFFSLFLMNLMFGVHGEWLSYTFCGCLFAACMLQVWEAFTNQTRKKVIWILIACAVGPLIVLLCYQAYLNIWRVMI